MESVIRLKGAPEFTLEKLLALGYFKTRNEAIRAGILELGKEYGVQMQAQDIEDTLAIKKMQTIDEEVQTGKRKLVPLETVLKKYKARKKRAV
jgi:Arc/MetJ-type ribon-helix-helix transcriptional regulator